MKQSVARILHVERFYRYHWREKYICLHDWLQEYLSSKAFCEDVVIGHFGCCEHILHVLLLIILNVTVLVENLLSNTSDAILWVTPRVS